MQVASDNGSFSKTQMEVASASWNLLHKMRDLQIKSAS